MEAKGSIDFSASARILPAWPAPQLKEKRIFLASGSPRRRELLSLILPHYELAVTKEIDENYPPSLPAEEVPAYLSRLKAQAFLDELDENDLVITADTVVILDDRILGKPHSAEEARDMLASLSGRTHTVVTGVTLTAKTKSETFTEHTSVTFGVLSADDIAEYVERYKPFDKAGAYGIQEWVGAAGIAKIDGCFYNVMGLPLHALYMRLRLFPIEI